MQEDILEFQNFILNQGLSQNTAINYCFDIKEFYNICDIVNIKDISENNVQNWSLTIKKKLTDNKTVNRKHASIKKFFNFLREKNKINYNYNKYLTNLKIREKVLLIPTVEDIFNLLRYIKNNKNHNQEQDKCNNWEDFRNYLIVKMIFTFGFRVNEVCSLKIEDFLLIDNQTKELIFKKNFVIKGKNNKERILPILDFISKDILALLHLYPKYILNLEYNSFTNQNLFLQKNTKNITSDYIEKFLRETKAKLGLVFDINPHIFRHACGTYLLENNVNIREIQTLLGHSNLSTTQRYTKVSKKTLIANLEKITI